MSLSLHRHCKRPEDPAAISQAPAPTRHVIARKRACADKTLPFAPAEPPKRAYEENYILYLCNFRRQKDIPPSKRLEKLTIHINLFTPVYFKKQDIFQDYKQYVLIF